MNNIELVIREKCKINPSKSFCTKRLNGECVARMHCLSPTLGEVLFYSHMLLAKFPAYSFEELREIEGKLVEAFQKSVRAKGLLTDINEYEESVMEAAGFKTGQDLRVLFVNLIIISGARLVIL